MFDLVLCGRDGFSRTAKYDPHTSTLRWADDNTDVSLIAVGMEYAQSVQQRSNFFPLSPTNPARKSRRVQRLKIQLGFKCNFSCEYCSQASLPNTVDGNPTAVVEYLAALDTWLEGEPKRIELWGGEPLLYWKSLQPLARGLRERFPNTQLLMITNGSLLDDAKIKFIEELDICVGISHDGPGQHVRGPDPLKSKSLPYIKRLYELRRPVGKISFNCVLTKDNMCISEIRQYIAQQLEVSEHEINLTTEELFTPYEENVAHLGPTSDADRYTARHKIYWESVLKGSLPSTNQKFISFFQSLAQRIQSSTLGQKCSADDPTVLSMDLYGNVLTCQNTTASDSRHHIGNVSAFEDIALTSSTHWSLRDECPKCPVLQLCRGSCMFTHDNLWSMGCDGSYTYNVSIFAAALYFLTGYVLTEIRGTNIRNQGVDSISVIDINLVNSGAVWDLFSKPKKVIPIKGI